MTDLKVNDLVLVRNDHDELEFKKIISFLHRLEDVDADFIRLHLQTDSPASDDYITLTPRHLIYARKENEKFEYIPAKGVQIGDWLKYIDTNRFTAVDVRVIKIEHVRLAGSGIYTPLTEGGTLIVDKVHVSCYSMVKSHTLANLIFGLAQKFSDLFLLTASSYQVYSQYLYGLLDAFKLTSVFLNTV